MGRAERDDNRLPEKVVVSRPAGAVDIRTFRDLRRVRRDGRTERLSDKRDTEHDQRQYQKFRSHL